MYDVPQYGKPRRNQQYMAQALRSGASSPGGTVERPEFGSQMEQAAPGLIAGLSKSMSTLAPMLGGFAEAAPIASAVGKTGEAAQAVAPLTNMAGGDYAAMGNAANVMANSPFAPKIEQKKWWER